MTYHPQVQAMRDRRAADGVPQLYDMSLAEARKADLDSIRAAAGTGEPVADVREATFPGPGGDLPVRIYHPSPGATLPVVVYFFGGGWTLGSIDTADGIARTLANAVPAAVVVPGYRLAPEHPFPSAVDDCSAAVRWAAAAAPSFGGDPSRIAVAGDSAGGNLAAVTSLLARSAGGPSLAGQALVYPNTDYTADDGSLRGNTDPWLFNATSVRWYWDHYLVSPEDGLDPRVSPLRAPDHRGLPPALVVTAEHDPLRDQGERYAEALSAAGVAAEARRFPGMVHGFFTMTGTVDGAREAQALVADRLRTWFGPLGPLGPLGP